MKDKFSFNESGNLYILSLLAISIISVILSFIPTKIFFGGMSLTNWLSYGLNQVAIVIVLIAYSKMRKTALLPAINLKETPKAKHLILAPFIALSCLFAFLPISAMFSDFLFFLGFKGGVAIPFESSIAPYLTGIILICMIPAIGEELLMRGGVLNGLMCKGGIYGIFISGLLFSLMHANPIQTIYQFCFGVILACMAVYSKSCIPCILAHFTNNLISLSLSIFVPSFLSFNYGGLNYLIYLAIAIGGFLVLVFFILLYYGIKDEKKSTQLLYDDITFTFEDEAKKDNLIISYFKSLGGLFTKKGWAKIKNTLDTSIGDLPYPKKGEGLSVALAIGITALWWVVALIQGFI